MIVKDKIAIFMFIFYLKDKPV